MGIPGRRHAWKSSVIGRGLLALELAGERIEASGEDGRYDRPAAACAVLLDRALDHLVGDAGGAGLSDCRGDHRLTAGPHQPHGIAAGDRDAKGEAGP
jgi:hypothetical protein